MAVHSKDRKHNISPEVILNIVLDLYRRCGDRRGNRTRGQGAVWFRGGRPGQASHRKRPQVCRESCSRSSSRQVKFTRNVDLFLVTHAKHENISSVFIDVCKRIMRCAAAFHFFTFMLFVFSNIHSVVRSIINYLPSSIARSCRLLADAALRRRPLRRGQQGLHGRHELPAALLRCGAARRRGEGPRPQARRYRLFVCFHHHFLLVRFT